MSSAHGTEGNLLLKELRALGDLCGSQGDFTRAQQHYKLALRVYESSVCERHSDALICLLKLIDILEHESKFDEARRLKQLIPELNARRRTDAE